MGSFQDIWNTYTNVWKKYSDFSGRASREEYWVFTIANLIVFSLLDRTFLGSTFGLVLGLAMFVPGLAVGMRRMHDTNRSGAVLILGLIPFVGWAVLLVFAVQEGTRGDNQYGPDPLQNKPVAAIPAA